MKPLAMSKQPRYWFPAKRYGWGWGFPATWQGWLVIAIYAGLVGIAAIVVPPSREPALFTVSVVLLSVVLTAVCWITGEPPHWRWGKRNGA